MLVTWWQPMAAQVTGCGRPCVRGSLLLLLPRLSGNDIYDCPTVSDAVDMTVELL